jgi:LAO/AO transport system kinase
VANSRLPEAVPALVDRALQGDRRALSRLISRVENGGAEAWSALAQIYPRTGRAQIVGVTGAPGTGKSTLVSEMAKHTRQQHPAITVGIVAVDPTSPFSGGAVLGDRIRMRDLAGDAGVFIRSMATRGSMGGLAVHTAQVCDVLDAAGFQRILIETVGVGQSELEVAQTADSTAVVLVPESGDAVQAMKAGLMEIGDVFVINKADREGADRAAFAVNSALELRAPASAWQPPVLLAVAAKGEGVDELADRFEEHLAFLREHGGLDRRRRQRLEQRLRELVRAGLWVDFEARLADGAWRAEVDALVARRATPHEAAARLAGANAAPVRGRAGT